MNLIDIAFISKNEIVSDSAALLVGALATGKQRVNKFPQFRVGIVAGRLCGPQKQRPFAAERVERVINRSREPVVRRLENVSENQHHQHIGKCRVADDFPNGFKAFFSGNGFGAWQ